MSVVTLSRFDRTVDRNYIQTHRRLYQEARQLLEKEPEIRESLEGFCNHFLSKALAHGVEQAIRQGLSTVSFSINIEKEGRRLWSSFPEPLKRKIPDRLIVLGLELLLKKAGFTVSFETHLLSYEREIPNEVPVPEPVAAGVATSPGEDPKAPTSDRQLPDTSSPPEKDEEVEEEEVEEESEEEEEGEDEPSEDLFSGDEDEDGNEADPQSI